MTESEFNTKYPWVKAYEALAQKLKDEYEKLPDKQKKEGNYSGIVSRVKKAFQAATVAYPITEDKLIGLALKKGVTVSGDDAKTFVAQQIDPFTIFQFCNADWKNKMREDLVKAILDEFHVLHPPTLTFNGIPIMPSLAPKIFHVSYDEEAKKETEYLWEMFVSLFKDDWAETFMANYKKVKGIAGWGDSYLKLFWVQPLKFLPLEKKSSAYLNFYSFANLDVKKLKKDADEYLRKCIEITDKRAKNWPFQNFVEFSDSAEVFANSAIGKAMRLLDANHNIVLHGAPGTGKTYMAKRIAESIGAEIEQVQFHPSYDYTDFVEGLRPIQREGDTKGGDVGFKLEDGTFKSFCEKALDELKKNPEEPRKYVFIIDEINRGDISKIFGELFFSIDPGYRGIQGAVLTQYSNMVKKPNKFDEYIQSKATKDPEKETGAEKDLVDATKKLCEGKPGHFFVPENVYIIGTMNDIDRSVESMDFAFRRRFAWLEVLPEHRVEMLYDELGDIDIAEKAKMRMTNLNKVICANPNLGSAYQIGPAYFLKVKDYDDNPWEDLWDSHLEGLLHDYLRGTESDAKHEQEKLKELKKAYDKADGSDND